MANSLNQTIVAEGVETEAQLAFLLRQHCEQGQGYYFSPPLSAEKFANLLETRMERSLELISETARAGR